MQWGLCPWWLCQGVRKYYMDGFVYLWLSEVYTKFSTFRTLFKNLTRPLWPLYQNSKIHHLRHILYGLKISNKGGFYIGLIKFTILSRRFSISFICEHVSIDRISHNILWILYSLITSLLFESLPFVVASQCRIKEQRLPQGTQCCRSLQLLNIHIYFEKKRVPSIVSK